MLGKIAREYYDEGYNCSQCIIKACGDVYKITINEQCMDMCSSIYNGFGICGMCSVLVAGVMAIGLMFDEEKAKRLRIKFLTEFGQTHKSINCSELKKSDCGGLIEEAGDLLEQVICSYK